MYSKKKEKKLNDQFKRYNELAFPGHKSDNEPEQRAAFIKQLIANPKFKETNDENSKRFAEPWREILKKMNTFDYIVLVSFMLVSGGFGFLMSQNTEPKAKIIQTHKNMYVALSTVLGLLMGVMIGFANTVSAHRINQESDIENFYSKLVIRLFDEMRQTYPDLDENILKQCNPEMARVITAVMIANMPESDTRKIQSIAMRIMRSYRNINQKNNFTTLFNYNAELKNALAIVEHNLMTNPALNETILSIYRGNVPLTFTLPKTR